MADDRVPVLWITGPAGVGKSTVSWQVFTELARARIRVAFADADQFCMCYPASAGDPGRERIKAQNLGAVVLNYRAAGAQCVIASGVLDPLRGVYSEMMPRAEVTVCRLRADRGELARRFTGRHNPGQDLAEAVEQTLGEADAMDASNLGEVCIDTTGVAAAEAAGLVRDACPHWPGFSRSALTARRAPGAYAQAAAGVEADGDPDGPGGQILLICGPTGVGKSTIGFHLYLRCLRDGLTAGYVDLDQIGFVRPGPASDPGRHRLKAANLAAMWRTYHAAGATHLIAAGPAGSQAALRTYIRALPAADVTTCRLHAGPSELTRRIISRGDGGSWPQPGDQLRGQPAGYLRQVADQAAADADALRRAAVATIRIDTDGRSAAQAAELIAARTNRLTRPTSNDR